MAKKLLLIKDVKDLGRAGQIVSVKSGYARNRLIPIKAAIELDKNALSMQARLQEQRAQQAIADKKDAEILAEKLNGKVVKTFVKVDHDGNMYGSVSANDIVKLLEEQHSIQLDKQIISLKHPVKETGLTEISLKLPEGISGTLMLKVMAEGSLDVEEEPASASAENPA